MKKKQHFVPQMILKRFSIENDSERCWEYNLHSKIISKKKIDELCAQNYLYEIRDDKGNFYYPPGKNAVENGFCKIEDQYNIFFDELLNELSEENEAIILSNSDIESIYLWISLLIIRNPMIMNALPFAAKELGISIESKISKSYNFIETMPFLFEKFFEDLKNGHIGFLKAGEKYSFVISDIPVIVKGRPLHEFCYMPVSSQIAILLEKPETILTDIHNCSIRVLKDEEVLQHNYMMFDALMNAYESELSCGNSLISNDCRVIQRMLFPVL